MKNDTLNAPHPESPTPAPKETRHAEPLELPWQALLDSAGEGIWGVDLEGRCTFVNRAALAMLGYTSDELVGQIMHDMVHHHYPDGRPYPHEECIVYKVFRKNEAFTNKQDQVFRKDGTVFWTEMSAQPIVVGDAIRGAVVTFRDTTQARQAEEALRRSEKLAAVGQLASSIAHEINNPLEAVINLLYLLRTSDTLEDVKGYALLAETELARVADIAMQTLRFHRQQTAAAPVDLNETITSVLRLYKARFSARKVVLVTKLGAAASPILLEGDLRQVLNNLIRNGYDAMPTGGRMHIRLRNCRCPARGVAGVRVTIADTGTGFLPKMREHLFEPFHTSKEVIGTGLGLWISKGIVDKHRGTMRMRSRMHNPTKPHRNHGTVFSLWLPLTGAGADASLAAQGNSVSSGD